MQRRRFIEVSGLGMAAMAGCQQTDTGQDPVVQSDFQYSVRTPESITARKSVNLSAEITNPRSREGSDAIPLYINGQVVRSVDITLSPGETERIAFEHTFEEAGTYEIQIGESDAVSVVVNPPIIPYAIVTD